MANTVYIGPAECQPDVSEFPASEAILPGQFLLLNSGAVDLVGAGATGIVYIALENILGETTEAYAADDTVQCARPKSGEYYEVVLAASQTIAKNGPLKSDANGNLIAQGGSGNILCYADEAVTTTGSTGKIRVYFV